ncbi:MAG TPA: hypothetical protein VIF35_24480 [Streptosporangiaceae bacterium]
MRGVPHPVRAHHATGTTAAQGTGSLPASSPQRSTDSRPGAASPSSSTAISAQSASVSCHATRAGSHLVTPTGRTSTQPPAPASTGAITWRAVSTS